LALSKLPLSNLALAKLRASTPGSKLCISGAGYICGPYVRLGATERGSAIDPRATAGANGRTTAHVLSQGWGCSR
jgi:hypothetical protein